MNSYSRFMRKRYGADPLSYILLLLSALLVLFAFLFDSWLLALIALLPTLFALYRSFSRNIRARRRENAAVLGIPAAIKLSRRKFRDRKTHVYFKCSRCGTVMRVPRGKGIVRLTCPRCEAVSERDTGDRY